MWSNVVVGVTWLLLVPASLIYLGRKYFKGAQEISREMDEADDKFEQDLLAIYAPMECGEKEVEHE